MAGAFTGHFYHFLCTSMSNLCTLKKIIKIFLELCNNIQIKSYIRITINYLKMTAKERDKQIKHWRKLIKKLEHNREFLYDLERQERDYFYSKIEEIREEWRLSKNP